MPPATYMPIGRPRRVIEPILVSAEDAFDSLGIGRTAGFALIRDGYLAARKCGARTMIEVESIKAYAASLPLAGRSAPRDALGRAWREATSAFARWLATRPQADDVQTELESAILALRQMADPRTASDSTK